jgi:hypothetical protein
MRHDYRAHVRLGEEKVEIIELDGDRRTGKKIGSCGQALWAYPEFARFLVEKGITSIPRNQNHRLDPMSLKPGLEKIPREDSSKTPKKSCQREVLESLTRT